ncbi:MAG TPA: efflux RND transporter periplasmic adaptor subunit [Candidatus Paceibacterota bacterium]|nr:efflux RND transporter periplasmic adaptor subunit [Candidatus Paceibacterota bacterium]
MKKIKTWIIAHKIMAGVAAVAVVAVSYGVYRHASPASAATKYVLANVEKGTLISSVSGSGQVAAQNQVTVTSNASGDITSVLVQDGDQVVAGQTLATIEAADASRAVDNAELALENARVAYDKAVKESENQSASSTVSDVAKAYQAGYNAIVATSIDLPAIFSGLNDLYYTPSHSPYFSDIKLANEVDAAAVTYKEQAGSAFDEARNEYQANFLRYKNISETSSEEEIVALLDETDVILKKLLGSLSGTYSTLDYVEGKLSAVPSVLTSDKSAVSSYVNKVNSDSSSITNALSAIDNAKTAGTSASLSMKSAELSVRQAESSLSDAQIALADHRVKAPFSGLVAKVIAKNGDKANNGSQIATLVTKEQMVNISLNEIDAAKIAKGDKATLTFDAIEDLTLAGHVSNVDLVGSVSQGVVSYSVQIAFDSVDDRVKPGMTVNASIVTDAKQDVLLVPSGAVKTVGGVSYVQILPTTYDAAEGAQGIIPDEAPTNIPVTIGSSNDSEVEIASGLAEGEQIVARTVTSSGATRSTTPTILNSIGGSRAGGNAGAAAGGTFRAVQFSR